MKTLWTLAVVAGAIGLASPDAFAQADPAAPPAVPALPAPAPRDILTPPSVPPAPPAVAAPGNPPEERSITATVQSGTNVVTRQIPVRGTIGGPRTTAVPAPPVPTLPAPALPVPPQPAAGPSGRTPALATAIVPASTNLSALDNNAIIPAGMIAFQSMPLEQVLAVYAEFTGRTVLRPNQLPAAQITLKTQTDLTKEEAIQALDSVLTLNQITMINVGDKFVTAVPSQQALTEGAAFSEVDPEDLPEAAQFVTKIVQLKYALPSEMQQLIAGFGRVQNGIIAIDSTMTLVIRDYAANIKRMLEIVEKVDIEVELDHKLEVIPIKYGKVEDIYSTMSTLIGGGGGVAGTTGTSGARRTSSMRGSSSRGATGGLGGSRSSLNRTPTGQVQPQQNVLAQPGGVASFNQRLQGIVSRAAGAAGEVRLLGDARIVPDERSNSLIVYAVKEDMQMITNIVAKVDRLLAQVLIEAIIVDVKITDSFEMGVSALLRRSSGKLDSAVGSNSGQGFMSSITNFSSGLPSGFSYFGKYGADLDLAVRALAADGKGQVLQTPRVQTSHAMTASFFTGESVPYITSTYYGGGFGGYGPSSTFQQLDVGIDLQVTPYITPDGLVVMEIDQNIEELSGFTEIQGVGKMPNTTRRGASATVSVRNGDTIILGGYIRTSKSKSKSGVPILKDIPLLGNLFRSRSQDNSRSELLVLLRPTVLENPSDAAVLAGTERRRLPGVRELERAIREEELEQTIRAETEAARQQGGRR
ncbi:MAG: hypothetical protein FJ387_02775 [Verrucomicrobia bacterium]|nr:hypothetical protein [Verrucomicrobiota bacterium]